MTSMTAIIQVLFDIVATFLRALPRSFNFRGGNHRSNENEAGNGGGGNGGGGSEKENEARSGGDVNDSRCPFEVLGLEGGRHNTTLEEATKARKKLAKKWHPDKNRDNVDEATKKMQEINASFHEVEQILSGDEDGGAVGISDSESEEESYFRDPPQSKAARQRARKRENRRRRDEEAEFERKMEEEMRNYERAQQNAYRDFPAGGPNAQETATSFATTSKPCAPSLKGKSKAARRRARRKANKRAERGQERGQEHRQRGNDNARVSPNDEVPFHRLSPEKRCEIKFGSTLLAKWPVFSAIRARAYHILQILSMTEDRFSDPAPLPCEKGEQPIVTPLMVASYLGDCTAADVIIQCLGPRWAEAVLAKSHRGDDCLSLAIEAMDIAKQLHDESKGHMDDAKTDDERLRQEEIIEGHRESYDMASKLVDRLRSMKQFALEDKRKRNVHMFTRVLAVGVLGIGLHWYFGMGRIMLALWAVVRFCCKYGTICIMIRFKPLWTVLSFAVYYLYTRDPASSPATETIANEEAINVFCADGESCLEEGDTCTDGIKEECCGTTFDSSVCVCGADRRYSCHDTNACFENDCEAETPLDTDASALSDLPAVHPVASSNMMEATMVVLVCFVMIGLLLHGLLGSLKRSGAKKRRTKSPNKRF